MIVGLGSVFEAAGGDLRTASNWGGVYARLPDAAWTQRREGRVLAARSWKTLLNDPHLQAIAFCLVSQILGDGLWFRSQYRSGEQQTDAVRALRQRINRAVVDASSGTRLDAGNMLTRPDLEAQLLLAGFFGGNGWAIRTWNSERPGCAGFGTCWRSVDADRVETPAGVENSTAGLSYAGTVATGIHVRRHDPTKGVYQTTGHDFVPFYDASGHRLVIHYAPFRWRSDSDLGVPGLASGLLLVHQLRELFKAHISGKRIQASHPIVVEVANPAEAAKAYQEAVEAGEADEDAQVLFVPKGSGAKFTTIAYQGGDLEAVSNVYLRGLCAAIGYPWQFVLCQLTNSNMAAAQAALDQAERTTSIHQRQWLEQAGCHLDHSVIREARARGAFGPLDQIPDTPDLYAGEWQRPRRADANRLRTRQAALLALKLGYSPSTVHDELGSDFEREQERLAEDRATSQRTGNPFPADTAATATSQVQPDDGAGGDAGGTTSEHGDETTSTDTDSGSASASEDQGNDKP